ncbi:hypothetical protein [Lysobacter fragariae]
MTLRARLLPVVLLVGLTACASSMRDAPTSSLPEPAAAAMAAPMSKTGNVDSGVLQGAPYRIDVPADWNGELVMFLHGYEPVGVPRPDPWPRDAFAEQMLAKGYAVAGSGYATQGWAVAEAVADNQRLREHFIAGHGEPRRSWLVGISMGGQIVLASAEAYPDEYAGALSMCGVNAPAYELFTQGALAPLVAFEVLFPRVLPQAPGGLADPSLPPMVDPAVIEAALHGNEAKAKLLAQRFDILREDLAGALMLQYVALREVATRAGGFPVDNRDYVYTGFGDDAAFNAAARRYTGDAKAMDYLQRNAPLTGRVATPVVLLSNRDDPTVPARFGARYTQRVREAGAERLLTVLPRVGKGHCALTPQDVDGAFATMLSVGKSPDKGGPAERRGQ